MVISYPNYSLLDISESNKSKTPEHVSSFFPCCLGSPSAGLRVPACGGSGVWCLTVVRKKTSNNVLDPCELLDLLTFILKNGLHWFEKKTRISLHVELLCTARY